MPDNCERALRPLDTKECYKPCPPGGEESPTRGGVTTQEGPWETSRQGEVILNPPRGGNVADSNVEWVASQWSTCRLKPGVTKCGRTRGIRYRNITCERKDRRVLMDEYLCARGERKPPSSEPCELLCRQDCIVTPFSQWTSCDVTCHSTNRTRTRRIVVPPKHRGDHCPAFSEMQSCDNCSEAFTYRLGDWGPCTLIGNSYRDVKSHHIIGHQSREISCLQSKGTLTTLKSCREKIPDALLYKHQACVLPQDCKVSTWSGVRPHNSSCIRLDGTIVPGYMKKTREVLQLPLGEGLACPPNLVDYVELEYKKSSETKPCKRAKWILSSWSVCTSVPGYSHCGTGIQSRRAICVSAGEDGIERPVDEVLCPQPKPLVSQACQTDCNWDCSVSQWSPWSTCQNGACSADAYDYMIRRRRKRVEGQVGKRYRTREILTLPGPGGRGCPHLSETKACEPQACFQWRVTYGACEASPRGGCGQGTRKRFAECVDKDGNKVKARFCWEHQTDNRPWEECYVPCPDDCVLSEWGRWSQCPDPCDPNQPGPAVRIRTRRILAYSGTGPQAIPCPNPSTLRESEQCPAPLECTVYLWKTSAWGRCGTIPDPPSPGSLGAPFNRCGPGTQTREVACYSLDGARVMEGRCEERVKPATIQNCNVKCPVDCRVTEWSEWSDCGTSCRAYTARQLLPKQNRQRFIVTYPQNGGLSCPHVLNEERHCLHLPVCETYFWDISDWSDCILPPIVPLCGNGLRARNVTCRHSNMTEFGLNVCLDQLSNLPRLVEPCYVACPTECQLSEWEPWGRCVQGCQGKRFRWRKLLGDSKTNPECKNQNKYPLDEHEDCVCDSLQPVVIGEWSDCILKPPDEVGNRFAQMSLKSLQLRTTNDSSLEAAPDQAYCGRGVRYKAISCQTSARDMEGASSCSASEYQEEECILPCPVDCQMTPWSAWSTCSVSCGSGIQQRFRSIQTLPQNGGRKCPSLYGYSKETQSRVCAAKCQHHQWQADDWGPCLPHGEAVCGPGTQTRTVGCFAASDGSSTLTLVDSSLCPRRERPENVQDCSLPCPGDCVLSQWTDWTPCSQPCNGQQTQTRSRFILRYAGQYSSSDCPSTLQDVRVCIKGDNCFEYSWELSDWTTCLINDGSAGCGVGHKERYALCRNDGGQRVEDYRCSELFGPMTERLVVSCEIPCDNDCLLSDWSDWTMCTVSCGLGITSRYRTTVQAPIGNGRKCPSNMEETRPCFKQGCYDWQVTPWSSCRTQNGVCGSGLQVRNVSCVGQDGFPVNSSRCPHDTEKLILKTRRACHVPCPGECRLSEWSAWSVCFISCQDFEQGYRTGVTSRSRAVLAHPSPGNRPCDDSLWEDRSCQTDTCLTFRWTATPWGHGTRRAVSCQRSDGLVVEGGCSEELRPDTDLRCDPPCVVPNSDCIDSDLCGCLGLYQPVYSVNSTLLDCTMNVTSTTTGTPQAQDTSSATSPWMYAVIAVGTIFVISVAAALYNMCELFRTGPRPRRKGAGKGDGASDTQSGTRTPVPLTDTLNSKSSTRVEDLYKQCQPARPPPPLNHEGPEDPAYQNVDLIDGENAQPTMVAVRVPAVPAATGHVTGNDVDASGNRHVGRNSMRLACSPEESEQLLLPSAALSAQQYACAGASSPSSSSAAAHKVHNRRYPAWQTPRQREGRGGRRFGVLSACFRGSRKVHREEEEDEEEDEEEEGEVKFKQKLYISSNPTSQFLEREKQRRLDSACVEVHANHASAPHHPPYPPCMPAPSPAYPDPRHARLLPPSRVPAQHISSPLPSITSPNARPGEEMELGHLSSLESEENRADVKNRGSLSNISEISLDKPVSESSLKLGITAESLQAAMTTLGKGTHEDKPLTVLIPPDSTDAVELPPPGSVPKTPESEDVQIADPRVLELLKPRKDWSLDSGRSTLPPSRNGSLETPSDASNWSTVNGKRQAATSLSPNPRENPLTFRQSLDNARAARKAGSALAMTLPASLHSPGMSAASSVASSSPSLRQQRSVSRHPSGFSSPDSRSVCDSYKKGGGTGDLSYTSDTPDSLSEMSDRSGMETTV